MSRLDLNDGQIFDVMAMVSFSKRCDTDVSWTNVTTATDAIIWTEPSLTMFSRFFGLSCFWMVFMVLCFFRVFPFLDLPSPTMRFFC